MSGAPARIPLWADLRAVPVNKRLPFWKSIEEIDAEVVVLGKDDPHLGHKGTSTMRLDGRNDLRSPDGKTRHGRLIKMDSGSAQDRAAKAEGIVIIDGGDWTIIPLENLIAARRDRPGTLFALARDVAQVILYRDTLEVGVHGIVLAPQTPADLHVADAHLRERGLPNVAAAKVPSNRRFLVPAKITRLEDAGPGDRVCVDTTSMFEPGEGMLVGSTAKGFALIHAETIETEYVAARPFRVNAGAVHSYLLGPDGKTQYLSEVAAGKRVLAVSPDGSRRALTVGRAKIEHRPHTLVAWTTRDGQVGSAVLQTAETIRLVHPDGTPTAVTHAKVGDFILVHTETLARHFGMPVDERLTEV